jgi:ABC-2 type transport system permease protein
MPQPEVPTGAIYDIGYQHYTGRRLGRPGAVRALYVQGLRSLFGIGRGGRAKIPPIALIALLVIPAVIQAALAGITQGNFAVVTHEGYFGTTVWIFGLFCAFQTPELVSGDQQFRVLALYFSRAVLRSDYVLARIASLATALFVVALMPQVIMLAGEYFAAPHVLDAIQKSLPEIPRILASAAAIALLLATVSITIAAVIRRRPLATAAILAFLLIAGAFVTPLVMSRPDKMRGLLLASPTYVGRGVTAWVFDTTTVRPPVDSFFLLKPLEPLPPHADSATIAARREERRRRFRMRPPVPVEAARFPGGIYLAAMAGYMLIAAGVLTLRYRSIET